MLSIQTCEYFYSREANEVSWGNEIYGPYQSDEEYRLSGKFNKPIDIYIPESRKGQEFSRGLE